MGGWLLLGVVVVLERPEDRDLFSLGPRLDRLGTALEEVQGLSGLLCEHKKKMSDGSISKLTNERNTKKKLQHSQSAL